MRDAAGGRREADDQATAPALRDEAHLLERLRGGGDDGAGPLDEHRSRRRELDLPGAPHEEGDAELVLETPDRRRERLLGEVELPGRAREAQRVRYGQEVTQLAQLQGVEPWDGTGSLIHGADCTGRPTRPDPQSGVVSRRRTGVSLREPTPVPSRPDRHDTEPIGSSRRHEGDARNPRTSTGGNDERIRRHAGHAAGSHGTATTSAHGAAAAAVDEHAAGGSHDKHAGHSVAMFRDRFWLSLLLSIPVVLLSHDVAMWLGYELPAIPGLELLPAILGTIVYLYGGLVFLRGAAGELGARRPGMMTLISLAITVAFVTSWAATLGFFEVEIWWELATLITIMLLGHWLEMRSIAQARGRALRARRAAPRHRRAGHGRRHGVDRARSPRRRRCRPRPTRRPHPGRRHDRRRGRRSRRVDDHG